MKKNKYIEEVERLLKEYDSLQLQDVIDFEKFNHYAIVHHSTVIEGSTLTEVETRLLLDESLTPSGKPLEHSLMVKDHYNALQYVLKEAEKKTAVTPAFIQNINAHVMQSTGKVYNTVFGEIDSSKGAFRKGNVSAGGSYFVNYDKVEPLIKKLCITIDEQLGKVQTIEEKLTLSFTVHFDLVSIHPFYDGNGRTSRLLMNFIQQCLHLPLAIVFQEDKAAYFEALIDSRKMEDVNIFSQFMYGQYVKLLQAEIRQYRQDIEGKQKRGGYSFVF